MRTMSYATHMNHDNDEFNLNQEGLFGNQNSFGFEDQQMFDFPEIELSDCDSVAMSLELENDNFINDYPSMKRFDSTFNQKEEKAISEKNTELENSFNSCKANFCDDSLSSVNQQIISEVETVVGCAKNILEPVLLKKFSKNHQKLEKSNDALKLKKKISKKKNSKKRRRKRMKKNLKKLRKVMLKKCSTNILQTFCMEFDDVFKLYPSLINDKKENLSTFPQVFNNPDNFCLDQAHEKNMKSSDSSDSDDTNSTMASEETHCFTEMKSTLVRSKVNILKGSMLCFEMTNNLREMMEISKCVKWQRRLKYRKELQMRGSEEDFSETDNEDDDIPSYGDNFCSEVSA